MSRIMFIGDIHGNWGKLNAIISKKKPDIVIQCGDWGWFPHLHNKSGMYYDSKKKWDQYGTKAQGAKIYWCRGNHDNVDDLKQYTEISELEPNIFYCPFGTVLKLPTNESVLFCSGAKSIDSHLRTIGVDWWSDEQISYRDINNLPDVKIDIVVSHTIPNDFVPYLGVKLYQVKDCSMDALDYVFQKYTPKYWYSGHFHLFQYKVVNGCKWFSLADIESDERYFVWHE